MLLPYPTFIALHLDRDQHVTMNRHASVFWQTSFLDFQLSLSYRYHLHSNHVLLGLIPCHDYPDTHSFTCFGFSPPIVFCNSFLPFHYFHWNEMMLYFSTQNRHKSSLCLDLKVKTKPFHSFHSCTTVILSCSCSADEAKLTCVKALDKSLISFNPHSLPDLTNYGLLAGWIATDTT